MIGDLPTPRAQVAILAQIGRDGNMICDVLQRAGISACLCATVEQLCTLIRDGADLAIICDHALTTEVVARIVGTLRQQPTWSDIPLIVLGTHGGEHSDRLFRLMSPAANPILLERPARPFTLVAMARSALRARERQYATRAYLEEIVTAREEIARHRDELADAVRRRTDELRDTHHRLRLSERMAALGTLAAGVGHDLANLLMPMRVRLDALAATAGSEAARQDAQAIRACIEHLQRLASGLRQLSLDPLDTPSIAEGTELGAWWDRTEPILRTALPRPLSLEHDIGARDRVVALLPHQLTQAVFNLVQNAGEAMRPRGSGTVRITTADAGPDHVRLTVADDGPGMTEEVKARCMEPLFTTKTRQLSTGLGLSLVQSMVRRANGVITLDSTPGHGTVFSLTLRTLAHAAENSSPRVAAARIAEPRIRGIVAATLAACGFEVLDKAAPTERCTLLVADADAASPETILPFLEAKPRRAVVVIGSGGEPVTHDRIVRVREPRMGPIREAIQAAVGKCEHAAGA